LGEEVNVVSAFQNVPADALQSEQSSIDCDVLVTGNNVEAREVVIQLAAKAGMRAFHAGPIDNSVATEALTSLLISINKRYKAHSGIRITGIPT
ncbi:MAG TPA: NADPH-dependent F420 reductase, partial [Gammaproteobacteria bacterium]|nr:NADPH-dependent F420 reductase [Gammaproteobacteria bacterium]